MGFNSWKNGDDVIFLPFFSWQYLGKVVEPEKLEKHSVLES